MNIHLTKEETQMANKHIKRCSTAFVIRELQIKTAVKYHYTPFRMAKIQNTDNTKCSAVDQQKLSFIVGGSARWYSHSGRQFGSFL